MSDTMKYILISIIVINLANASRASGDSCGETSLILLSGQISSPKHPPNDFYNANEFCQFHINVGPDPNRRIIMNFTRFVTEACLKIASGQGSNPDNNGKERDNPDNCDWVKVFSGNSTKSKLIGKFSGVHDKPFVVETGDNAIVQFKSNGNLQRRGFVMDYHTQYRGKHFT